MKSIADTVVKHINIVMIGKNIVVSQRTMTYKERCDLGQHFRIPYFKIFAKTSESVRVIFDTFAVNVLLHLAKSSTKIAIQSESQFC
jgi:hypothetical protein